MTLLALGAAWLLARRMQAAVAAHTRALYRAAVEAQPELKGRFLFMTGDTANPIAWQFLQDSRVAVMEKPFAPDALRAAIARLGS